MKDNKLSEEINVLAMDGAYYREETVYAAEIKNIELNFSNMTGRKAKIDQLPVTQFEMNDDIITSCPAGHQPIRSSFDAEKQVYKATFSKDVCNSLPDVSELPDTAAKEEQYGSFQ